MSTGSANNFSFFVGAFGLFTTVLSVACFGRLYLPSIALETLDATYRETEELYLKASSDGLLPNPLFRDKTERTIKICDCSRKAFRESVYQTIGLWDEIREVFKGLTKSISDTTNVLRELRSIIVTTTQETRRELELQRRRARMAEEDVSDQETLASLDERYTSLSDHDAHKMQGQLNHSSGFISLFFSNEDPHDDLLEPSKSTNSAAESKKSTGSNRFCLWCTLHLHRHHNRELLPIANASLQVCECTAPFHGEPCMCHSGISTGKTIHMMEVSTVDFPSMGNVLHPDAIRYHSATLPSGFIGPILQPPVALSPAYQHLFEHGRLMSY